MCLHLKYKAFNIFKIQWCKVGEFAMKYFYAILAFCILESAVFANPYPDPNLVPKGLGRSLDFN
jgi:hypothetical protein